MSSDQETLERIRARFDNLRQKLKDDVEASSNDKERAETIADEYDSTLHAQQEAELKILSLQQNLDAPPGSDTMEDLPSALEAAITRRNQEFAAFSSSNEDAADAFSQIVRRNKDVDDAAVKLLAHERRRTAFHRIRANNLRDARDRSNIDLAQSRQIIKRFRKNPEMSDMDAKRLAAELQSQVVNTTRQLIDLRNLILVPTQDYSIDSTLDLVDSDNDTIRAPMPTELDAIKEELRDAIAALERAVRNIALGNFGQDTIKSLTAQLNAAEARVKSANDRATQTEQITVANALNLAQNGGNQDVAAANNRITTLENEVTDLNQQIHRLSDTITTLTSNQGGTGGPISFEEYNKVTFKYGVQVRKNTELNGTIRAHEATIMDLEAEVANPKGDSPTDLLENNTLKKHLRDAQKALEDLQNQKNEQERACEHEEKKIRDTIRDLATRMSDSPPPDVAMLLQLLQSAFDDQDKLQKDLEERETQIATFATQVIDLKKQAQVLQETINGFVAKVPTSSKREGEQRKLIADLRAQLAASQNATTALRYSTDSVARQSRGVNKKLSSQVERLQAAGPDLDAAATRKALASAQLLVTDLYGKIEVILSAEDREDFDRSRLEEIELLKAQIAGQNDEIDNLAQAQVDLEILQECLWRLLRDGVNPVIDQFAEIENETVADWLDNNEGLSTREENSPSDAFTDAMRKLNVLLSCVKFLRCDNLINTRVKKSGTGNTATGGQTPAATESEKQFQALEQDLHEEREGRAQDREDLEGQIQDLQAELTKEQARVADPTAQNGGSDAPGKLEDCEKRVQDLNDQISTLQAAAAEDAQEIADQVGCVEQLQNQVHESPHEGLEDCHNQVQTLLEDIYQLNATSMANTRQLIVAKLNIEDYEKRIKNLNDEIHILKKEAFQTGDEMAKQNDLEGEIDALQTAVVNNAEQIAEEKGYIEQLQNELGELPHNGLEDCQTRVQALLEEVSQLKAKARTNSSASQLVVTNLNEQVQTLQDEAHEDVNCEKRVRVLKEEASRLKATTAADAAAKTAEVARLNGKITRLQNEIANGPHKGLKDCKDQVKGLREEISRLGVVADARETNLIKQKFLAQGLKSISNTDGANNAAEVLRLNAEVTRLNGVVDALRETIASLDNNDDLTDCEERVERLQAQIDGLDFEAGQLGARNLADAQRIRELEAQIAYLEAKYSNAPSPVNSDKAGTKSGKAPENPYPDNRPGAGNELLSLRGEVGRLHEGADAGQAYIDEQIAGIVGRDARITLLEERLAGRETEIAALTIEVTSWQDVVWELENTQEAQNAEVERLQRRITELENANNVNDGELNRLRNDHGGDAKDVATLRALIATLREQVAELTGQLAECKLPSGPLKVLQR
jgi:chromosome segregation ATPase